MNTLLRISLMSAALAVGAAADLVERDVSHLKLRPQACVRGATVTLADIVDFSAADTRLRDAIGNKPVLAALAPPAETAISHDRVTQRLAELGVNMARVLLSGALTCRVTLEPAATETAKVTRADAAPLLRSRPLGDNATRLADVLRTRIEQELASVDGTVEIEFEHAGAEFLELTSPPFDFSIRSNRGRKLGLRELTVTLRRNDRTQRTVRIGARVKLVKPVLVAARPLNVGTYVRRDNLTYASRIFCDDRELGIDHPEQVVGQQVRKFVAPGRMVLQSDLEPVDLVKRSQPVTVIGGDKVGIRITGDALDSGGYGDTIRVRLGNSRRTRREIRGVVTGVGTVRLVDGTL